MAYLLPVAYTKRYALGHIFTIGMTKRTKKSEKRKGLVKASPKENYTIPFPLLLDGIILLSCILFDPIYDINVSAMDGIMLHRFVLRTKAKF